MDNIRFGTGGFPPAFKQSIVGKKREHIFAWLASQGLNAFEMQMTRGPRTPVDTCNLYRRLATDHDVRISIHGAYYIVLASKDAAKVQKSADTLSRTFDRAELLGAREVVIHPGSLYGEPPSASTDRFIENYQKYVYPNQPKHVGLFVESAGKVGQLGSVSSILEISAALRGVHPCIDFGHVHARTGGRLACVSAINEMFNQMRKFATCHPEKRWHFHYTPIEYGHKGEIKHRALTDICPDGPGGLFHPRPEPIAESLKKFPGQYTVISETLDSQDEGARALRDLCESAITVMTS